MPFCLYAYGQQLPQQIWHSGEIVLSNGEVISGKVKYNLETETVQLNADGMLKAFGVNQVREFTINEIRNQKKRVFQVFLKYNEAGFKRPHFFETLEQGEVSLFAREYVRYAPADFKSRSNRSMRPPMDNHSRKLSKSKNQVKKELAHKLFILNKDGHMIPLGNSAQQVVSVLGQNQRLLRDFIDQEKLRMEDVNDVFRVVSYYQEVLKSSEDLN